MKTRTDNPAHVKPEVLSDDSVAWNVHYVDAGVSVRFGCKDQRHAEALAFQLNDACFGEVLE